MKKKTILIYCILLLFVKNLSGQVRPDLMAFVDSTGNIKIPPGLVNLIKRDVSYRILEYRMLLNPVRNAIDPDKVLEFYLPDSVKLRYYYFLDLEVLPWKVNGYYPSNYYLIKKKKDLLINYLTKDTIKIDIFSAHFPPDSLFVINQINPAKNLYSFAYISGGFFLSDFHYAWFDEFEEGDNSLGAIRAIFLRLGQFWSKYKEVSLRHNNELHTEKYYNFVVDSFPLAPNGGRALTRVKKGIGPHWDNVEVVYYTNDPPIPHLPLRYYEVKFVYKSQPRYNDLQPKIRLMDDKFYLEYKGEPLGSAYHINKPKLLREQAFCGEAFEIYLNPILKLWSIKLVPKWNN